ncbi:MAG: hypothetical protein PVH61_34570 [Candidatus Aminicenantes bacterium]|jgi:hypothetical protein
MKKTFFLSIVLFILFISVHSIAEAQEDPGTDENPMASFMGAKWGMSAEDFTEHFRYKDDLKKEKEEFFALDNFELGGMIIKKIRFKFDARGNKDEKLLKKNYNHLFLSEAFMYMKSDQFETLLQIFKTKYGDPTKYDEFETRDASGNSFLQKVARWEAQDIKRLIIMEKQASKLVDGTVMFIPIKPKVKVEKKDKIKEAAEKI